MSKPILEFEEELSHLTNDQYAAFVQERIARLNPEQQKIALAREVKRNERLKIMDKVFSSSATEEDQENFYNYLRDEVDHCEHGRPYCKNCTECGEIDHVMFPELFDENGERISDDV